MEYRRRRNLVFHVAETDWVLCADTDHVVSAQAMEQIVAPDRSNQQVVYTLGRKAGRRSGCVAIVNFLMHRGLYFEIGGHDEDFSGHYGSEETVFRQRLRRRGVHVAHQAQIVLDWYPRMARPRPSTGIVHTTRDFSSRR